MNDYYVFNTEQEAINAELQIRELGNFPLSGVNAMTGEVAQEGLTTAWATPQQRLDGKWVFPRIPENLRQQHADKINLFASNNVFTIEPYSPEWFPVLEYQVQ